jgi:hypothetical protein
MLAALRWESLDLAWVAVALLTGCMAALLWLYPPQLSAAAGRWRWILPVLRTCALVALALSVVQPIAARPRTIEEKGAVLLLLDQSKSMGVSDSGRTSAQAVALADGMGLLPAGARVDATAGLRPQIDQMRLLLEGAQRRRSEADYARLSGRGIEATRRRLEESASALRQAAADLAARARSIPKSDDLGKRLTEMRNLPAAMDEPALRQLGLRLDQIVQMLAAIQSKADAELYGANPRVRALCNELDRLSRLGVACRGITQNPDGLLSNLPAGVPVLAYGFDQRLRLLTAQDLAGAPRELSDRSDIAGAVRASVEIGSAQPVQAIVLFSDGRQVGGNAEVASDLSAAGVPVFAVCAADTREQRDVSIAGISTPSSAFAGERIPVRVELRAAGCAGEVVNVELEAGGRKLNRRLTIDHPSNVADFDVTFTRAGPQEVSVSVSPLAGELSEANNRAQRWIKVLPEKIAVACAADWLDRSFEHLCSSLAAAPWIRLERLAPSGEDNLIPVSTEQLGAQNVLVLCNLRAWSMTDAQWEAIDQWVSERGGSLILTVSDSQVLEDYQSHAIISTLLPYDPVISPSWRSWPDEEGHFLLRPDQRDRDSPARGPTATQSGRWQDLAPVSRFLPILQLKPNAQALLVERSSGAPAVTTSRVGLGKVLFIGTGETWRWQTSKVDGSADPFWTPLIRLAAEEPYAAHEGNYWLDADAVAAEPGQPLHVRARVTREDGSPARSASQELQLLRAGQILRTVPMEGALGGGRYEVTLGDLEEGEYELRINTHDDLVPSPRLTVRVASSSQAEMADLSPDPTLLRHLAASSGGEFLTLEQLSSLPHRLAELRDRPGQTIEYPLWDSPYLFVFVVGCLSLEWALRKRFGLE